MTTDTTGTHPLHLEAPAGLPFLAGTREFDAPVADLWRAHVEPELIARWLGPGGYDVEDVVFEARDGGSWSFTHRGPDGNRYGFRGVVHAIAEHRTITRTFEFDGVPGHVTLERLDLEDLGDGRTRLRMHNVFQSVEARDGMVASGMERGLTEGYAKLDALLAGG